MAEIENVVVEEVPEVQPAPPANNEPAKSVKFVAGLKERGRKFIVKLKHKTHLIPLAVLVITSIMYLCMLNSISYMINENSGINSSGICMFVNTLLSVLVLLVFLNAFPKRKKPNIVMLVGVFVVLAVMIALDIIFYVNCMDFAKRAGGGSASIYFQIKTYYPTTLNNVIVHIVFLGISILALAFLPLYKKGINKINTKKALAENEIKEEIDTSAEV